MKQYLLFIFLFIASYSQAQYTWVQKPDIPAGTYFPVSFVIDGKAYVGLGSVDAENHIYTPAFFRYDPATNTWDTRAPFPGGGRFGSTAFAINGKGYVCFGFDNDHLPNNDVWEYDPVEDSWLQLDTFPGARRYVAASFVIGNKAYIEGGSYNSGYFYLNDFWCFDPSDGSWLQKASIPVGQKAIAVGFSMNNKGYIAGGSYMNEVATKDFWEYDPSSGSWTQLPDMCYEVTGAAQFMIGSNVYVGTGMNYVSTFTAFCVYDTISGYWPEAIYPPQAFSTRYGATSFTINDAGYIVGGRSDYVNFPSYILSDMWGYGNFTGAGDRVDVKLEATPNPSTGKFKVSLPGNNSGNVKISVFNITGQVVYSTEKQIVSNSLLVDLSVLSDGIYMIMVQKSDNSMFRAPVVISR